MPRNTTHSDVSGKLIVIEGADGSGRSTQKLLLHDWLEQTIVPALRSGIIVSALNECWLPCVVEALQPFLLKVTLESRSSTCGDRAISRRLDRISVGFTQGFTEEHAEDAEKKNRETSQISVISAV
jgi:hypothetical protein